MNEFINAYFHNLAANPTRFDSMFQWTLCTLFLWFFIWKYRERIIAGMSSLNLLFESGEVIAFVCILCFPPILFNIAFFKGTEMYQWYTLLFIGAVFACTLYGRYIFDWALAFKTGASQVTQTIDQKQPDLKATTTTIIEAK